MIRRAAVNNQQQHVKIEVDDSTHFSKDYSYQKLRYITNENSLGLELRFYM